MKLNWGKKWTFVLIENLNLIVYFNTRTIETLLPVACHTSHTPAERAALWQPDPSVGEGKSTGWNVLYWEHGIWKPLKRNQNNPEVFGVLFNKVPFMILLNTFVENVYNLSSYTDDVWPFKSWILCIIVIKCNENEWCLKKHLGKYASSFWDLMRRSILSDEFERAATGSTLLKLQTKGNCIII